MNRADKTVISVQADPEPIEINILETAVIVVDMQNAFLGKSGYFDLIGVNMAAAQRIIQPCKDITNLLRLKGARIIYLQAWYSPDPCDSGGPSSPSWYKSRGLSLIRQHPELKDKLYIRDTWGAEIIEELRPRPADITVKKQKHDGFIGTDLDSILRSCGTKYLVFIGTATNICVESTLRHAFFLDYFSILVSDAVSQSGPRLTQKATIFNVQSTFGWVTTSEKLLNAIGGIENQ